MTLSDWLKKNGRDKADFASEIGTSYQSVVRYCNGERTPSRAIMMEIVRVTGGAVLPNDFYGVEISGSGASEATPEASSA